VQKPAFRQSTQRPLDQATTDSRTKLRQRQTANPRYIRSFQPLAQSTRITQSISALSYQNQDLISISAPRLHLSKATAITNPATLPAISRLQLQLCDALHLRRHEQHAILESRSSVRPLPLAQRNAYSLSLSTFLSAIVYNHSPHVHLTRASTCHPPCCLSPTAARPTSILLPHLPLLSSNVAFP
jgi:hypothetical protein